MMDAQFQIKCSAEMDIAAYVDGELDPSREIEMEAHFSACETCRLELTFQKQFLMVLDSSLRKESEIDLPANFTRQIVANAESKVTGLRRPSERYNAIFICAALFLFVLFALSADLTNLFANISQFAEQSFAVAGFMGRFIFSLLIGVVVVLRSLAGQFRADVIFTLVGIISFASILLIVSRTFSRFRRV